MSGLRFNVGEVVTIEEVGPFGENHWGGKKSLGGEYLIRAPDGRLGVVRDYQLRKIDPPAEPASLTRTTDEEVTT